MSRLPITAVDAGRPRGAAAGPLPELGVGRGLPAFVHHNAQTQGTQGLASPPPAVPGQLLT